MVSTGHRYLFYGIPFHVSGTGGNILILRDCFTLKCCIFAWWKLHCLALSEIFWTSIQRENFIFISFILYSVLMLVSWLRISTFLITIKLTSYFRITKQIWIKWWNIHFRGIFRCDFWYFQFTANVGELITRMKDSELFLRTRTKCKINGRLSKPIYYLSWSSRRRFPIFTAVCRTNEPRARRDTTIPSTNGVAKFTLEKHWLKIKKFKKNLINHT